MTSLPNTSDAPNQLKEILVESTPLLLCVSAFLVASIFTYTEIKNSSTPNTNAVTKESQIEYESRGRRGGVRRLPIKSREESPVDLREGSPRTRPDPKANGEINRRLFYRYLLHSLLLRTICLPIGYIFPETYQISCIVAQTLPILSSALAYTVLVMFYAQVTLTATGGTTAIEPIQSLIVKGSYSLYAVLVGLNCVIPVVTGKILFFSLHGVFCFVYLCLFISMSYFGLRMINLLRSNMPNVLGCRLIGMSTICCVAFILRSILFGMEVYSGLGKAGVIFWDYLPGKEMVGYLVFELLPAACVLLMMHRKKTNASEAQDQAVSMEAGIQGQVSPFIETQGHAYGQNLQSEGKKGENITTPGVKRSFSANGSTAVPFSRQHNQGQHRMASNSGSNLMSKSVSNSRPETVSLLGDKSQIAVVSAANSSGLYGAIH